MQVWPGARCSALFGSQASPSQVTATSKGGLQTRAHSDLLHQQRFLQRCTPIHACLQRLGSYSYPATGRMSNRSCRWRHREGGRASLRRGRDSDCTRFLGCPTSGALCLAVYICSLLLRMGTTGVADSKPPALLQVLPQDIREPLVLHPCRASLLEVGAGLLHAYCS